ncbi:MAG TPA: hypothetical protein VHY22_06700 [Chthoniobacteraceae bacterium]|nr:hypothetical protein [Chthoniobacteraceae bacterium]
MKLIELLLLFVIQDRLQLVLCSFDQRVGLVFRLLADCFQLRLGLGQNGIGLGFLIG